MYALMMGIEALQLSLFVNLKLYWAYIPVGINEGEWLPEGGHLRLCFTTFFIGSLMCTFSQLH